MDGEVLLSLDCSLAENSLIAISLFECSNVKLRAVSRRRIQRIRPHGPPSQLVVTIHEWWDVTDVICQDTRLNPCWWMTWKDRSSWMRISLRPLWCWSFWKAHSKPIWFGGSFVMRLGDIISLNRPRRWSRSWLLNSWCVNTLFSPTLPP